MTGELTTISQAWDIKSVDAVFDEVAGHLNAQHGRLVANAVWMLDHVGEWQGEGLWTPEAYIVWRTGIAVSTARKVVDVARRAAEFPDCVAAMTRGELSLDQIAPIVRHAPGWCDRQMAGLAPRCTVAQISKIARQYPWEWTPPTSSTNDDMTGDGEMAEGMGSESGGEDAVSDTCGESAQSCAPERRAGAGDSDTCWFGYGDDGRFRLHLEAGADVGLVIEAAMSEARDAEFNSGNTNVTNVDALVAIANRSLGAIPSASRRNRYRINLHMETAGVVTGPRGDALPAMVAQHLTCDGTISPIFCADGVPVSVGRAQHIVPDRTRRIVEHRDGGCRVPGCTSRHFTEVHHIHTRSLGPGSTTMTAHVVVDDAFDLHDAQQTMHAVQLDLAARFGIAHSTIQLECHACEDVAHG